MNKKYLVSEPYAIRRRRRAKWDPRASSRTKAMSANPRFLARAKSQQNYLNFEWSPPSNKMRFLFSRAKRGENFFESLTISCAGGCRTHAGLDLGRRVEQRWPYYFLCRRLPHTRCYGPWPARRAEAALLFLVREAATHTGTTWAGA